MKPTAKQQCAVDLRRKILSMEKAPGQPLDETQLSAEYGISRTPLREVIQKLAGEGYLTLEENRGAKVAPLDLVTLRHFFHSAPMIYASIARLAAEQADLKDIARIRKIQHNFRSAIEQGEASEAAIQNHRFHAAIGDVASSPYLMPSLNRLLIDHTRIGHMFYRSNSAFNRRRIEDAADQHDAMIEAFATGNAATSVNLTLQHWDLSRGQMERFVSPDPLPFDLEGMADAV